MAEKLMHRDDLSDREIVVWALKRLSDDLDFPYNNKHAQRWVEKNYTPAQIKTKDENHDRVRGLLQALDNGDVSLDGVIP